MSIYFIRNLPKRNSCSVSLRDPHETSAGDDDTEYSRDKWKQGRKDSHRIDSDDCRAEHQSREARGGERRPKRFHFEKSRNEKSESSEDFKYADGSDEKYR